MGRFVMGASRKLILQDGVMGSLFKCLTVRCAVLFFVPCILLTAGCGDPGDKVDRKPMGGKVTFKGKETGNGSIVFMPTESGQSASGAILGGKYSFTLRTGPPPGKYRVVIRLEG